MLFFFFFQAEDGIRDWSVTGVQTCALPISHPDAASRVGDGPHMVGSRVKNSTRYLRQRRCVIPDNPAVIRIVVRSEERRVGKECRYQWTPYHRKKKEDKKADLNVEKQEPTK